MTPFSKLATLAVVLWFVASTSTVGQQPATAPSGQLTPAAPQAKAEEGIPIPNAMVQKACAPCHTVDEKQQISRISFRRNTPEGWQETIRRMVALNGLRIEPAVAREVVKYLSDNLGLAPEEVRPAVWELERRIADFKYENQDAENVCKACHTLGRVLLQRRTREEWNLLIAMHRGFYPLVDSQGFRRPGPPPREPSPDGRPPDRRHPVEKAVDHLATAFPLKTAEWAAWSATMRPARLAGTWAISAAQTGKGPIYGTMVLTQGATPDEFTSAITLFYARTGARVTRSGQAIIYTGFQWRGRSSAGGDEDSDLREVMMVDRDWRTMEGRWFTGAYDEIGLDVKLERVDGATRVLGTERTALRVGSAGQSFRIYGANLPTTLQAADVDLGPGVIIKSVSAVSNDQATITVDVASSAVPGVRDLFIGGSRARGPAIYDSIDAIKVTPDWAMARVGGVVFPKALAQFEAHAFDNGPDNRPDTPDDIDLGYVPATWSIEEFAATYGDDDIKFVGTIHAASGLFTPNVDGPNPNRAGSRNNVGDVYAVATYTPESTDGKPPRTLRARAHLLVTVPLYMRWEAPGTTR